MLQSHQLEEMILLIASLDREAIKQQFLNFHGRFPVDFTPEFLDKLTTERLRHIFVALCLQSQYVPNANEVAVA